MCLLCGFGKCDKNTYLRDPRVSNRYPAAYDILHIHGSRTITILPAALRKAKGIHLVHFDNDSSVLQVC